MSKAVILKHPSKDDRDPNRFVLVNNMAKRWVEPQGMNLSDQVLQEHARTLGPMGLAVYVAWQFLAYMGKEPSTSSVAAFLGCQKVTVKKQIYRLQFLGLIEEQGEL